jgi:glycosyltransferase involved in cell wall biosynthesis
MKVSIVMAYYNRRTLLIKTLESITKTQFNGDFEIIIVDDASTQPINDIPLLLPKLNLRVIQIDPKDKWWVNPCIPNNIGFETASGEIIIIQNPECLHVGDVISYAAENTTINKYISFGCYAIDHEKTRQISDRLVEDVLSIISPTNDVLLDQCPSMNRWYQHSVYSPRGLNFCTSITREDLKDLGGFDEVYAPGISYDDTEFIRRVRRKGMVVDMVDNPFVVHQWHPYTNYSNKRLVDLNTNLYNNSAHSSEFRVVNTHSKELARSYEKRDFFLLG